MMRFYIPLLACLAVPGCNKRDAQALPPPFVAVMEVVASDVPASAGMIGRLDSPQNVEIRARVEGFVDKMSFTEGTQVQEGAVLFELDRKPYLEKLAAAQGNLAEANAALNKYQKDVARLRPLAERRAIPMQDLDNALAAVEVGEAGIASATAQVESAQLDLGYTTLKAPITGMIGAAQVSIGELVGKGEPTLLATISKLDPIWFYCNVSEYIHLRSVEKARATGQQIGDLPVSLILSDGSHYPEAGKFVFIDRAVDTQTGTIRVRAEFPNKDLLLRPGMFARIVVDLGARKNVLTVPERALVDLQGRTFLWVVGKDNTASQRAVVTGERANGMAIITGGLVAGERIIVEGVQKVREGAPVQILPAKGSQQ
jgi:RND family efflux transporter MFP subunit